MKNTKYKSLGWGASSVYLLNRRIDLFTTNTVIDAVYHSCIENSKIIVSNYNVHAFNLSLLLPQFFEFQESAAITVCDGMGILKGLEIMGTIVPSIYKVPLTVMVPLLLQKCERENLSVFLLGSKPQYLDRALEKQRIKHPNLRISGHHGYFDRDAPIQNELVIRQINQFQPDILIVGMGMPLQELWIKSHYNRINATVTIPCGAVIDRLAGCVNSSPEWMSNIGLEWLYRLIREPRRLAIRYLLGNPLFLLHLCWAKYHNPKLITGEKSDLKVKNSLIKSK